ncbi:HAD-IB family hydrolase [Novosphingobium endophyticum]|uniref:HAD-IB family hydrolase n=1 Tax=Novosphingobium endophyticum TaxID=1955250 RepID=UPI0016678F46|nr:HAD-IB family hydrolase [Novosphingobium endophyticum]
MAKAPKGGSTPKGGKFGLDKVGANLLDPMTYVNAYTGMASKVLTNLVPGVEISHTDVIEQIRQGPQGPDVIAAFDFDGTLIGGYSGSMLFNERKKRKEVSKEEMTESITIMFKTMAKMVEANEMVAHAFSKWEGKSEADMEELGGLIYENTIQDAIFPEMREILQAHRDAGHTIVVATSASRYQAEHAVKALGIEHLLCSELEVKEGKLTGKLAGQTLFGEGKAAAIKAFVEGRACAMANTHFYADGSEEVGLMELVGSPRPVNPRSKLREAAKKNNWPILNLSSRGSAKPMDFLRNIAGMASIGAILQTGLAAGAFTGDKRTIANTVMPAWITTQMKLAGVKMRVSGRENLARRPAVFIFNHRNFYDGMIAAALVRTDYAAIAREEMGQTAVGKLIQKIMPTVLIKRGTGSRGEAAKALRPVVEAMNKEGYSVLLSPEGTRTKGNLNSVGPFKKGAFHMAMAAGVPVVPIVIRNALDIAGRNQGAMRPGIVDVAVLPPVSVADWTAGNMAEKIESVRQMYIDTLNDFPAPDDTE